MILDPVNASQQSKKEQEALQQTSERGQEEYTEDRPPEYTSVPQNDSTPDGAGASSPPPPLAMSTDSTDLRSTRNLPDLKPSNFVHLSRSNSSVKGVWIVDPSMIIPAAFLPPLEGGQTEETRENLYLFSKNGAVDAEVYLLPRTVPVEERSHGAAALVDTKSALRPQVIFRARSNNGSVTLKIHEVPPEPPRSLKSSLEEVPRSPIHITCWSSNGSVNIYLPRSFQGPLSLSTRNGSVHFSDAIKPLLTHFSEVNGGQRSFLGDFDARKWSNGLTSQSGSGSGSVAGGEWVGDMLKADSMNGSVRVAFDDEQDRSPSSSSKSNSKSQGGFFGRIFGGF